jgi:long-chain acyl-CoA synthetase
MCPSTVLHQTDPAGFASDAAHAVTTPGAPYAAFVAPPLKLLDTAARLSQSPAYWTRGDTGWQATTWAQYAAEVRQCARALLAMGVQRGDAVAILSFNCPQWSIAAFAAMSIGAFPVGIYWTSASADIAYILGDCRARVLVLEDEACMTRAFHALPQLRSLQTLVQIRGEPPLVPGHQTLSWRTFMAYGEGLHAGDLDIRVNQALASIQPTDTGSLIYTSGTTGPAKAVVLSHGNLWWMATTLQTLFKASEHDRLISYLPLAHIAEQMGSMHNQAFAGFAVYYARSIEQLGEHLKEVHPTIFFGVPRVWEKMQIAIEDKLRSATGLKAHVAQWALGVGQRWHQRDMAGQPPGLWLTLQRRLANRLIYRKVKLALGFDQARLLSTGAAPISQHSLQFFTGLDLPVRELYGQSEACGPSTISLQGTTRLGSVGQPLPGTQIRVADDGELLIRGAHIFQGYLGQAGATAQAMSEAWLLSGDLGHIDEDGYVYITGRKKDLIITSGGKNISPANIEAALMDDHLIAYAVVCGDGRHYLSALLTLEAQQLAALAAAHGLTELDTTTLCQHPLVLEAIQQVIDHVNTQQARVAQIRKFAVLTEPFSIEGGELTPTLKVKRKVVLARQQAVLDALYAS